MVFLRAQAVGRVVVYASACAATAACSGQVASSTATTTLAVAASAAEDGSVQAMGSSGLGAGQTSFLLA